MNDYYAAIFTRRSIRKTKLDLFLTEDDIAFIKRAAEKALPLIPDIKTTYTLVPRNETTVLFNELVLSFYSERKENYLLNAGYILEQIDLALNARRIGVCWYGTGTAKIQEIENKAYVIRLAIAKGSEDDFHPLPKRKETASFWRGPYSFLGDVARLAPSAVNSQPWVVRATNEEIAVYRERKKARPRLTNYFNIVDSGIFLYFLELAMNRNEMRYERIIAPETSLTKKDRLIPVARYIIR